MPMRATTIRFSDDLWEDLEREAGRRGVSAAQFIRDSTLLRIGAASAEAPAADATRRPDVLRAVEDPSRLAALRDTNLLDSRATPAFDRLTRLASRFLHTPVALVTLVAADRQFLKSCLGLPEPWASRRETPLSHSFCQHVVARREPLLVSDARQHPELRDSLAIDDLDIVAYAGVPLVDRGGHVLGSLCAIDHKPRHWTGADLETLEDLAEAAVAAIDAETAAA
jgi:GAF domain-containing protein